MVTIMKSSCKQGADHEQFAGLDQKILVTYSFIYQHYKEGDSILIIGLSRGAFIARCVVAFTGDVGVLHQPSARGETDKEIYTE